jgi:hypothetical protein
VVSPVRPDLRFSLNGVPDAPAKRVDTDFSRALAAHSGRAPAASSRSREAQLVAPEHTPLSGDQAAAALSRAYTKLTGERPSPKTVAILTAQWAHETGRGASMYNYNFGGIKGAGPSGLSVSQRTTEGFGSTEQHITDRFRAYRSAGEGALDYVHLLKSNYPKALEAARQGDSEGFVHALKARGYFTGNEDAYVRSVGSMAERALSQGAGALGGGAASGLNDADAEPRALSGVDDDALLALGASANPAQNPTPFVDALRIADEISRAALRIASSDPNRSET